MEENAQYNMEHNGKVYIRNGRTWLEKKSGRRPLIAIEQMLNARYEQSTYDNSKGRKEISKLIRAGHDALFEGEFVRALHVAEEVMRRSQSDCSCKGEAIELMAAVGEKLGRKGKYWRRS